VAGELIERQRVRDGRPEPRRAAAHDVQPAQRVERRHDDRRGHEHPPDHASLLAAVTSPGRALGRQTRQVCEPGDMKNLWCTP
jgi:hypothetical protein